MNLKIPNFCRTSNNFEVDFIAYGEGGLFAFEIKRGRSISRSDLSGLKALRDDYKIAKCYLLYAGYHEEHHDNIDVIPFVEGLKQLIKILVGQTISGNH